MQLFKIRCSAIHQIMGKVGLTEKQKEEIATLEARDNGEGKPLTEKQKETLAGLREKAKDASLPSGATSYLKQWYAEHVYGDREEISTKQTDKGNRSEAEALQMTEDMLNLPFIAKNQRHYEGASVTGTPDAIFANCVFDTKCSWNGKTFLDSIEGELVPAYFWQMQGYMMLTGCDVAKVCYCLLNTPEDVNYGNAVYYDHIPKKQRFKAFTVCADDGCVTAIQDRVKACRIWLDEYDRKIKGILNE